MRRVRTTIGAAMLAGIAVVAFAVTAFACTVISGPCGEITIPRGDIAAGGGSVTLSQGNIVDYTFTSDGDHAVQAGTYSYRFAAGEHGAVIVSGDCGTPTPKPTPTPTPTPTAPPVNVTVQTTCATASEQVGPNGTGTVTFSGLTVGDFLNLEDTGGVLITSDTFTQTGLAGPAVDTYAETDGDTIVASGTFTISSCAVSTPTPKPTPSPTPPSGPPVPVTGAGI